MRKVFKALNLIPREQLKSLTNWLASVRMLYTLRFLLLPLLLPYFLLSLFFYATSRRDSEEDPLENKRPWARNTSRVDI